MNEPDVGSPPKGSPERVDLLVSAGWVVTVDAKGAVIADGAVAVADGQVVGVGPATELRTQYDASEVVELPGHAVIPGLVNAHTHLGMTMFRGVADDLALDAFLARLLPAEGEVLSAERVHTATLAAAVECLCSGTTMALDMYYFADHGMRAAASAVCA